MAETVRDVLIRVRVDAPNVGRGGGMGPMGTRVGGVVGAPRGTAAIAGGITSGPQATAQLRNVSRAMTMMGSSARSAQRDVAGLTGALGNMVLTLIEVLTFSRAITNVTRAIRTGSLMALFAGPEGQIAGGSTGRFGATGANARLPSFLRTAGATAGGVYTGMALAQQTGAIGAVAGGMAPAAVVAAARATGRGARVAPLGAAITGQFANAPTMASAAAARQAATSAYAGALSQAWGTQAGASVAMTQAAGLGLRTVQGGAAYGAAAQAMAPMGMAFSQYMASRMAANQGVEAAKAAARLGIVRPSQVSNIGPTGVGVDWVAAGMSGRPRPTRDLRQVPYRLPVQQQAPGLLERLLWGGAAVGAGGGVGAGAYGAGGQLIAASKAGGLGYLLGQGISGTARFGLGGMYLAGGALAALNLENLIYGRGGRLSGAKAIGRQLAYNIGARGQPAFEAGMFSDIIAQIGQPGGGALGAPWRGVGRMLRGVGYLTGMRQMGITPIDWIAQRSQRNVLSARAENNAEAQKHIQRYREWQLQRQDAAARAGTSAAEIYTAPYSQALEKLQFSAQFTGVGGARDVARYGALASALMASRAQGMVPTPTMDLAAKRGMAAQRLGIAEAGMPMLGISQQYANAALRAEQQRYNVIQDEVRASQSLVRTMRGGLAGPASWFLTQGAGGQRMYAGLVDRIRAAASGEGPPLSKQDVLLGVRFPLTPDVDRQFQDVLLKQVVKTDVGRRVFGEEFLNYQAELDVLAQRTDEMKQAEQDLNNAVKEHAKIMKLLVETMKKFLETINNTNKELSDMQTDRQEAAVVGGQPLGGARGGPIR